MALNDVEKFAILCKNPHVIAVYNDPKTQGRTFTIVVGPQFHIETLLVPDTANPSDCNVIRSTRFRSLEFRNPYDRPQNVNQQCQNEPITLGTQMQPNAAPWVGTAGLPVAWTDPAGKRHWGVLSNWHVMSAGEFAIGTPQHQPTDYRPAFALLSAVTAVQPNGPNTTDAAIADALIDGFHTIDWNVLGIGHPASPYATAYVGMPAVKAGRTTGVTGAVCSAVGAAVRVGYDTFEALFVDQDIYTDVDTPFSAPGDSGSCIFDAGTVEPASLLFAGGGNMTVGNPMKAVAEAFNLDFKP